MVDLRQYLKKLQQKFPLLFGVGVFLYYFCLWLMIHIILKVQDFERAAQLDFTIPFQYEMF
jgi:hypothetical protein